MLIRKSELREMLNVLIAEHDEHMKRTYDNFVAGEEPDVMWAYGAGMFHTIRRLQDFIDGYEWT